MRENKEVPDSTAESMVKFQSDASLRNENRNFK